MNSQLIDWERGMRILAICIQQPMTELLLRRARFSKFMAQVLGDTEWQGAMQTVIDLASQRLNQQKSKSKQ